jgi:crotonobetainyl-CoA:carnitine CoA-transferase CaiB-like acyl-CoA transferase
MAGPLDGIRVIDLTAIVSGPHCTMLLADQGAEVIKVEPPGGGDLVRYAGTSRGGLSATFAVLNRGKRSVALDLRERRGVEILHELVRRADVFAENFRPGAVDRIGIGYEALREIRPELIYLSISGFGRDGPYARKRVYDPIIQALSGMASVQAHPEIGEPDLLRNIVCDKVSGVFAAQAVCAALFARERGAGGQHLALSMLDAAIGFLWSDGMSQETLLGEDVQAGVTLADFYQVTRTADGFMTWFTVSDTEFQGLCRVVGHPEWAADPRFATLLKRTENVLELMPALKEEFAKRPTTELIAALEAEDVPCAPINAVREIADDPQVRHSRTLEESDHPRAGRMRQPRPTVHFETTPARIAGPAPMLGEHTDEVLGELGIGGQELASLRADGVVG